MFQKMRSNKKGFTLIELMIVIAIIGILAAIAIPNFISYRNKSFCSRAESDGGSIAAAIADYFAIPTHVNLPALGDLNAGNGMTLSGTNVGAIAGDPNTVMIITVTDGSTRCPVDYQTALPAAAGPPAVSGWNGVDGGGIYTKYMAQ